METLAAEYFERYGTLTGAIRGFVADLMRGNPAELQAGYSEENAVIAASEVFDVSRAAVRHAIRNGKDG